VKKGKLAEAYLAYLKENMETKFKNGI